MCSKQARNWKCGLTRATHSSALLAICRSKVEERRLTPNLSQLPVTGHDTEEAARDSRDDDRVVHAGTHIMRC